MNKSNVQGQLYNAEHNDVDEDGVIRASKLILSSRSEYFQKMFDQVG